ncbi:MAG: hypothetical protein JSW33_07845 [bacterium]|nr:MAG: hypothetical protein JSW33_07845 [bacterium]
MSNKRDIILGLLMFLANFLWAVHQNWSATDLVWSLWISSLVLGYAYILVSIAGMLFFGKEAGIQLPRGSKYSAQFSMVGVNIFFLMALLFITGFSKYTFYYFFLVILSFLFALSREKKDQLGLHFLPDRDSFVSRLFIQFPGILFILGFFSFHFIFFHFVHSIFLNGFFPILQDSPFGKTMDETVGYFFQLITISLHRFWVFILLSALSRYNLYTKSFKAGNMDSMFIPYKNVVRMHLTIFLVAFLSMADLSHYALYFIFIIYFMPMGDVIRLIKSSCKKESIPDIENNRPIH